MAMNAFDRLMQFDPVGPIETVGKCKYGRPMRKRRTYRVCVVADGRANI